MKKTTLEEEDVKGMLCSAELTLDGLYQQLNLWLYELSRTDLAVMMILLKGGSHTLFDEHGHPLLFT